MIQQSEGYKKMRAAILDDKGTKLGEFDTKVLVQFIGSIIVENWLEEGGQ